MKRGKDMLDFTGYMKSMGARTLYVFDIDDTLFKTNALIHVRDASGKIVQSLGNQTYNTHKLLPGQTYDLSDFRQADRFEMTSKPIVRMLDRVKGYQKNVKDLNSKIIFVTARSDLDDKEKFLSVFRKFGIDIDNIHIYRVGNDNGPESTGEKKAKVVRGYLSSGEYDTAYMFDDNLGNLDAFKDLGSDFPDISFFACQAFQDGSIKHA
jgi:hypothetical protein